MSSAIYACWLCPDKFKTNRDRKNHLIARPHERMRVICPLCPVKDGKREKSLRRMADLKVHVLEAHKQEGRWKDVPADFFSEANGFWFALHPQDYKKLVHPNPWRSEAATRARTEMITWIRNNGLSSRRLREFEQGWEVGRSSSLTPEEHFKPDYSEDLEEDPSPVVKKPRGYSPSKPELDEKFTIKAINIEGGLIRVHVMSVEDEVFNIVMTSEASRNPQILSSVMRKSQNIRPDPFFQLPTLFTPVSSPSLLKEMSKLLGVDVNLIESVRKGSSPPVYVPSRPSSCSQLDLPKQAEMSTSEAATVTRPASSNIGPLIAIPIGTSEPQDADVPQDSSSVTSQPLVDSTPPVAETPIPSITSESKETVKKPLDSTSLPGTDLPDLKDSVLWEFADPVALCGSTRPSVSLMLEAEGPQSVSSGSNELPASSATSQVSQLSSLVPPSISEETSEHSVAFDFVTTERARVLLEFGVMPLLSAARRNWQGVPPFNISLEEATITWPPAGWETFTPDQKLQVWEFAALSLETNGVLSADSFSISRSQLLSKFNMLCLPGSAKPTMLPKDEVDRKLKFYNYKKLCDIAVKGSRSADDIDFLTMMEAASLKRSKKYDSIIDQIKKRNVPVRLS